MPSIRSGSSPRALSATSEEAPKSTSTVPLAVSRKKQVLNRPPEPKASPHPTIVIRMSGRGARPGSDIGMPALEVLEFVRHRELCRLHEIDGDETGDIGHRERIPRNKRAVLQLVVENGDELLDARLVGLSPRRHLRHFHLLHCRVQVAKDMRNRKQQVQLEAAIPHLDARKLQRAASEQRRIGLERLEVAADRDRLRDYRAVVEN